MTMLLYKAWLECKMRLMLCLLLSAFLLLNAVVVMPLKLDGLAAAQLAEKQALYWTIVGSLFIGLMTPVFAILLAGTGVNSQTNWGLLQGFHPSMYFALSLPVTRGQMLLARAGAGAGLLLPVLMATHAALALGARWRGIGGEGALLLEQMPRVVMLGLTFYCFAVFLAAVFDELWSSMIGLALAGGVLGYSFGRGVPKAGVFYYVLSDTGWNPAGTLALAGVCVLWLAASYWAVRRKEY